MTKMAYGAPATIVIVNAEAVERRRLGGIAKFAGHRAVLFPVAQKALRRLQPLRIPLPLPRTVLVIDSHIDIPADDLIQTLRVRGIELPLLVTVPAHGVIDAVKAVRQNAVDILEQPVSANRFLHSISTALASSPQHG
jgi:DNA-binding NtrC family response regulator